MGKQGGFRYSDSPAKSTVRLVALYTSGHNVDWPDELDPVVPAGWQLEVANALLDAQSHGRLSEAQAIRFLASLDQLPVTVDHSGDDTTAVHAAARRHNLSAYQASYLVLAERRALPLVTSGPTSPRRDNLLAVGTRTT